MGDSTSGYFGNILPEIYLKILYLRPSTPSCMVYGEVGKLPLQVTNDKRLMSFWLRLLNKEESSLAHIVYMIAHNLFVRDVYKAQWLCRVKHIVDNCGLCYLWLNQSMMDTNHAKQLIHTRTEEVALHNWYTDISTFENKLLSLSLSTRTASLNN